MLHKKALLVYLVLILFANFGIVQLGLVNVNASVESAALLNAHNHEREAAGLSDLSLNNELSISAADKANVMLNTDCWSHYCPADTSPWQYFTDAGYSYIYAGENLAEGFDDVDSVMSAWMNSPTHKENVLNANFTEIGFGFAYGDFQGIENNTIIVVHFGTPYILSTNQQTQQTSESAQVNSQVDRNTQVSITSPTEGLLLNSQSFDIKGTVIPQDSEVTISSDEQNIGKVDASGSNFTYNAHLDDGSHTIQAKVLGSSDDLLAESEKLNITVDTIAPELYSNTLTVTKTDINTIRLTLQGTEEIVRVSSNYKEYNLTLSNNKYWHLDLGVTDLDNFDTLILTASDKASNSSNLEITSDEIVDLMNSSEDKIIDISIISSFLTKTFGTDLRSTLAAGFTIYLLILFIIDFYMLWKTDMIHAIKRKSNLNISMMMILLLMLTIGGLTGRILTGTMK